MWTTMISENFGRQTDCNNGIVRSKLGLLLPPDFCQGRIMQFIPGGKSNVRITWIFTSSRNNSSWKHSMRKFQEASQSQDTFLLTFFHCCLGMCDNSTLNNHHLLDGLVVALLSDPQEIQHYVKYNM